MSLLTLDLWFVLCLLNADIKHRELCCLGARYGWWPLWQAVLVQRPQPGTHWLVRTGTEDHHPQRERSNSWRKSPAKKPNKRNLKDVYHLFITLIHEHLFSLSASFRCGNTEEQSRTAGNPSCQKQREIPLDLNHHCLWFQLWSISLQVKLGCWLWRCHTPLGLTF